MTWVRTVGEHEAQGYIRTLYEQLRKHRGFVPNVIKSTTIRPELTQAYVRMAATLMFGPSELTRVQREMLATVTSVASRCRY